MCDDDQALLNRITDRRDEAAFDALSARYRETLRRFLLAQADGDAGAADDLLQEALLRLWTRADSYDGRGPVKAWLFRVAGNLALNHRRTLSRRRESALVVPDGPGHDDEEEGGMPLPAALIEDAAVAPDARALRRDEARRVRSLLADLPDETREMLRMVHEEERDLRDVAAALGIPEGTVKSRLHHTRKRLARAWEERERPSKENPS